jgi:uncharacterized membrane protein
MTTHAPIVSWHRGSNACWGSTMKHLTTLVSATAVALLLGCQDPDNPVAPASGEIAPAKASGFAKLIVLPTLSGRTSEALAVNAAGTVVVGYSWERGSTGTIRAVKWTLGGDGSWTIVTLPHAAAATGAIARGVDNKGDGAGNDFPGPTSDAVLWPSTGGFNVLSCAGEAGAASVYGISADGQTVVGGRTGIEPATAAVWRPGGCKEDLPPLVTGAWSRAHAANGEGTIVGGTAALTSSGDGFPARWTWLGGQWQVEQLDQRPGVAFGANGTGDLAGLVRVSCSLGGGCQRAIIWYTNGGSRELGTLGGNDSWARDINAAGEVVGVSTSPQGNTGYFWSESTGMLQLPFKTGCCTAANAVSDARPDGTRLVAGIDLNNTGRAVVWVVQ